MASRFNLICIAAALAAAALLFAAPQAQASSWDTDMVPVWPPFQVLEEMAAAGAPPTSLQCRCCSKSNPSSCQMTTCCFSFTCDPTGKCNFVQTKCGCKGY